jgi:hypothetical protein
MTKTRGGLSAKPRLVRLDSVLQLIADGLNAAVGGFT